MSFLPKRLRFFKRYRVFPGISFNLSRHGMSTTVGIPHAHVTWGKNASGTRHMRRVSVGIPGTGIWRQWSKTRKLGTPKPKKNKNTSSQTTTTATFSNQPIVLKKGQAIRSNPNNYRNPKKQQKKHGKLRQIWNILKSETEIMGFKEFLSESRYDRGGNVKITVHDETGKVRGFIATHRAAKEFIKNNGNENWTYKIEGEDKHRKVKFKNDLTEAKIDMKLENMTNAQINKERKKNADALHTHEHEKLFDKLWQGHEKLSDFHKRLPDHPDVIKHKELLSRHMDIVMEGQRRMGPTHQGSLPEHGTWKAYRRIKPDENV